MTETVCLRHPRWLYSWWRVSRLFWHLGRHKRLFWRALAVWRQRVTGVVLIGLGVRLALTQRD